MYGIVGKRSAAIVLSVIAASMAVAGCDSDAASADVRPSLRYQMDAARGRLWALTKDGVELYDAATRRKVAQIALPGWIWVGEPYSCPPVLAVGPGGEALISSNVIPTLWRIDPITLEVSKHEPVLDEDEGKDIGFTGLAYSARQGAYFAVSAMHGSRWRIDPLLQRAQNQHSEYVRSGYCES